MTPQQIEIIERSLGDLSVTDKLELVGRLVQGLRLSIAADRPSSAGRSWPMTEDVFKQQLLESGLMSSLPIPSDEPRPVFEPIVIEGEPISETIIRERR